MGHPDGAPRGPGGEQPGFTRDEALAFIESLRLTLEGKAGFSWLAAKLALLADYVAQTADDSELMRAFIEERGLTDGFRAFGATRGPERTVR